MYHENTVAQTKRAPLQRCSSVSCIKLMHAPRKACSRITCLLVWEKGTSKMVFGKETEACASKSVFQNDGIEKRACGKNDSKSEFCERN